MLKTKSDQDSGKEYSKSADQNVDEGMIRLAIFFQQKSSICGIQ